MKDKMTYQTPVSRCVDIRFEHALLQGSGTDRADDGYNPGIDLGDLE